MFNFCTLVSLIPEDILKGEEKRTSAVTNFLNHIFVSGSTQREGRDI